MTQTSHCVGNPTPLSSVQKGAEDHQPVFSMCKTSQGNQVLVTKWQWTTRRWLSYEEPVRGQEKPSKCDVWVVLPYNHHLAPIADTYVCATLPWLWNSVVAESFPVTYNLNSYKSRVVYGLFLNSFPSSFLSFSSFSCNSPCLIVAVCFPAWSKTHFFKKLFN